jgi:hypothetical protein
MLDVVVLESVSIYFVVDKFFFVCGFSRTIRDVNISFFPLVRECGHCTYNSISPHVQLL